ncbi:hypothetical protein ABZ633_27955, partial [Streptomyces xanthochromogenes]
RGRLAVDNLGNQPLTASFSTRDNGDAANVEANPTAVQVDPGRAGFAEVELTAVNVSWFGGTRQHPFTVAVLRPTFGRGSTGPGSQGQDSGRPAAIPTGHAYGLRQRSTVQVAQVHAAAAAWAAGSSG